MNTKLLNKSKMSATVKLIDWLPELEKMLTGIEQEATSSLQNIKNSLEQTGQSFPEACQKYCQTRAIDR